jgi:hypothetical protein
MREMKGRIEPEKLDFCDTKKAIGFIEIRSAFFLRYAVRAAPQTDHCSFRFADSL